MAFTVANLQNQNSMSPGLGTYIYKSDTDVPATVIAAGYFNNTDDLQNFGVDDRITVTGDQGGYELYVVSLSSGSVTTAVVSGSSVPIAAGSTLTLTRALHDGRIILLDTLAGSTITLPLATGLGTKFTFIVSVAPTSNDHSITCAGSDEFQGVIYQTDTDTADAFVNYPSIAADTNVSIDLNGTTSGGLIGDRIEIVDCAAAVWSCVGHTNGNGTVVTPWA